MNSLLPTHQKYGYNGTEQLFMLLITAVTNFGGIPVTVYLYRSRKFFEAYISFFTVATSFMYHALDSIDIKQFFLTQQQWHILDNIGSISSFMIVFIYLMDNRILDLDLRLYLGAFTLALLSQFKDPWNIIYTVAPIAISGALFVMAVLFRKRKPKLNFRALLKASLFLVVAVLCFTKGLKEKSDYLRIFHGLWHLNIFLASFFIWQARIPRGKETKLLTFWRVGTFNDVQPDQENIKIEVL